MSQPRNLHELMRQNPNTQVEWYGNHTQTGKSLSNGETESGEPNWKIITVAACAVAAVVGIGVGLSRSDNETAASIAGKIPGLSSNAAGSAKGDEKYTAPPIDCMDVAEVQASVFVPVAWDEEVFPSIKDSDDYGVIGSGQVAVRACVGDIAPHYNKATTKKLGLETYTLKPGDITFEIDTSDYKKELPAYTEADFATAKGSDGSQEAIQGAKKVQQAVLSYSDELAELHAAHLPQEIVKEYGDEIVKTSKALITEQFKADAASAGFDEDSVYLEFTSTDGGDYAILPTDNTQLPDESKLPFSYLEEETVINMKGWQRNIKSEE